MDKELLLDIPAEDSPPILIIELDQHTTSPFPPVELLRMALDSNGPLELTSIMDLLPILPTLPIPLLTISDPLLLQPAPLAKSEDILMDLIDAFQSKLLAMPLLDPSLTLELPPLLVEMLAWLSKWMFPPTLEPSLLPSPFPLLPLLKMLITIPMSEDLLEDTLNTPTPSALEIPLPPLEPIT